ncbi:hypothetical protein [Neomoorella thermoacetica]|uniref:hypothetical protein n=1 Tax=Neomoorella thermoacetica TaxID=1525 RepID=UPI0030D0D006
MRNPTFGKWLTDDCPEPSDPLVEAVDLDAQAEFDRAIHRLSASPRANPRPERREIGEASPGKKKVVIRVRTRGPVFVSGNPYYARPFTRSEAEFLLTAAGVRHEGVVRTYLAPWTAVCDPDTLHGPGGAQVVVTRMRADEGSVVRNVHLFFVYDERKKGWKLVKASVELAI